MRNMTYADKLTEELLKTKMPVTELAEASNICVSTIYRYLRGKCKPKKDTKQRISYALDAKKHALLALLNDEDRAPHLIYSKHWGEDIVTNLCSAIVLQAVKDYTANLQGKKALGDQRHIQTQVQDCETFFRSDWFTWIMPDIDGEKLIDAIQKKHLKGCEE